MFERFTDRARRAIILAQEEAKRLRHNAVGTEHILLGLIRNPEGVGAKVLESLNISLDGVRAKIESTVGIGERAPHGDVPFTPRGKKVLELALNEARGLKHNYIGTEHLLLGLISEGDGVAARVLETAGAGLERTRAEVVRLLEQKGATAPAPDRPRPSEAIWRVVPNVKSSAFDESRKFYSDFLGFKVGMDMGWIVTFVSPSNPTAQISILQSGRAEGHPDLSIEVADVDGMYSKAVAGGFKIVYPLTTESWGVRRFFVEDPNGVVLNVMSHTRGD